MVKTKSRKLDNFKLYYWHGANLVGKCKMPELASTQYVPFNVISFSERSGITKPFEHWVDFFIDDYRFETFWSHAERSLSNLHKFAGVITPDFSMYPEMLPVQRVWNCTRNRVMAYYLQSEGIKIIPVASWCTEEDFKWCFDGLPVKSSIAISTNGCLKNSYSLKNFLRGVEELYKQKAPSHLIVCGRQVKELDCYSNIFYYPSFSQRMEERIA